MAFYRVSSGGTPQFENPFNVVGMSTQSLSGLEARKYYVISLCTNDQTATAISITSGGEVVVPFKSFFQGYNSGTTFLVFTGIIKTSSNTVTFASNAGQIGAGCLYGYIG